MVTPESSMTPPRTPPAGGSSDDKVAPQLMIAHDLLQMLKEFFEEVALKLYQSPVEETKWQKRRKRFAEFAKDFGPLFTGIAAIMVSLAIGFATAWVSILTYQSNAKQATLNLTNLKTTTLNDFTETDKAKRTLAAIKLASYGEDAFPVIKFALGVTPSEIRSGGVETAQVMYQSRSDCRQKLLAEMLLSFQDLNPTLRLGVLEFYRDAALQLTFEEKRSFLNQLIIRLGPQAQSCVNEDGDFVFTAVQFLTTGPFPEARNLLLNIARNCPHGDTNPKYSGARNQAVHLLPLVLKQQHASKMEREETVNSLRAVEAGGSEEFTGFVRAAINEIDKIQGP